MENNFLERGVLRRGESDVSKSPPKKPINTYDDVRRDANRYETYDDMRKDSSAENRPGTYDDLRNNSSGAEQLKKDEDIQKIEDDKKLAEVRKRLEGNF